MPTPSGSISRRQAIVTALILGLALMWFTGAITRWGQWYSEQPFYRAQVQAFFEGRLALSHHVEGVTHDLAWVDGGVQHVWGLGVPIWMSLWEGIGRLFHVTPFPDRIAMMLGAVLVLYALMRAWLGPGGDRSAANRGAFLITAFLPGVVMMMRGRIAVYEEADAYAYGAAMLLVAGVLVMLRRPSTPRYVLLLAFAGATGLIRPTVWFYGLPTAVIATVLYVQWRGGLRAALAPVALASALFVAGGGALYGTNYVRFGSGTEFGHRLNLEDLPGNIYATRFGYPFQHVPLSVAAKELVGGMFGRPELHARAGYHFYDKGLHAFQADTPRWREYYFTTYTLTYIPVLIGALVLVAVCWLRLITRRRAANPDKPPAPAKPAPDLARETRWLGAWAIVGSAPLLVFYLRSPSMSSRYFLDIAPTIAVLLVIAWRHGATWMASRGAGSVAFVALVVVWAVAILYGKDRRAWQSPVRVGAAIESMLERTHPLTSLEDLPAAYDLDDPWLRLYLGGDQMECACWLDPYDQQACDHLELGPHADVELVRNTDRDEHPVRIKVEHSGTECTGDDPLDACDGEAPDAVNPDAVDDAPYALVERDRGEALYGNGTNWDMTTGAIGPATYLFVDDPDEIDVEVAPDRGPAGPWWIPSVRADLELDQLRLIDTESTTRGVRFRFAAPTTARYRHGLQVLFLAFGSEDNLDQATSGYMLWHVGWHGRTGS